MVHDLEWREKFSKSAEEFVLSWLIFQTNMTVHKNNIENCVYLQSKGKGGSLQIEFYLCSYNIFCKNLTGETHLFAIGCVS